MTTRRLAMLAAIATALFVALGLLVHLGPIGDADARVVATVHERVLSHPGSVPPWRRISAWLGPDPLRIVGLLAAAVLWWRRRPADGTLVALAALGTLLLSSATKALFDRDRPQLDHPIAHAAGQSYPSGHALTSFVAGATLLVLLEARHRRIAVGPVVLAVVLVGASRIVLGVHFPTDLLGGWLLGLALMAGLVLLVHRLELSVGRSRLQP